MKHFDLHLRTLLPCKLRMLSFHFISFSIIVIYIKCSCAQECVHSIIPVTKRHIFIKWLTLKNYEKIAEANFIARRFVADNESNDSKLADVTCACACVCVFAHFLHFNPSEIAVSWLWRQPFFPSVLCAFSIFAVVVVPLLLLLFISLPIDETRRRKWNCSSRPKNRWHTRNTISDWISRMYTH